ncbi:adenylate/guanylate cyclase domain-containing protein [Gordonia sp. (in: high G+C Gram-positive bacteria)]|uniref:adenylate/guanylate cyclase domain-containing protein n=1 Tax=Gordonia sp. (in: high G+C Gram-positive bacteria) TaxID=84139 RepID=UPI003526DD4B
MELQRQRDAMHEVADRLEACAPRSWVLRPLRRRGGPPIDGELLATEWRALDQPLRERVLRRAAFVGISAGIASRSAIGLETFILVLLAFTGGRFTLNTELDHPSFYDMLIATVIGSAVSIGISYVLLRRHFLWFAAGEPADDARRRSVARIPIQQVGADILGWVASYLLYALIADVTPLFLVTVGGAFTLAAVTSCSLTYLFAESSARPLAVLALSGTSESRVMHGVRERMFVVWMVSSAVPMVGLIALNTGRWAGWLPPAGRLDWAALFLAVLALTSGLTIVMLVGRAIADPLTEMRSVVEAASRGDLDRRVAVYDSSELGVLQSGLNAMLDGLAEREHIRTLFSRHVGDRVAELAISREAGMVGTNTDVAVVFVDLTGSTAFASQRDPRETAVVLNVFFSVVAEVVERHDGLINKFEGDAALIIFGAPTELDDPAGSALRAARELGEALSEKVPLEWGMGVGYGQVFAGNIGAASRYEYTVIGDPVNEAARLSDRAKEGGAPVCASGAAVAAADPDEAAHWSRTTKVTLRGRSEATEIYVPTGLAARAEPPTLGSVLSELLRIPGTRARDDKEKRSR